MKRKKFARYFASFMILNIFAEIASPTVALALTNGPVQQEFTGFEPANSSEMVDLFTGDFKYNIPLMDVDGYPLNLSYKAGVNMESEASWVGLGWSMNPGVLNRLMKGLPDDFNGDNVHSEMSCKPFTSMSTGLHHSSWFGTGFSLSLEGIPVAGAGMSVGFNSAFMLTYNNYKGFGYEKSYDSHFSWNLSSIVTSVNKTTGYGVSLNSQDGGSFTESHGSGRGYIMDMVSTSDNKSTTYNTRNGSAVKTISGFGSVSYQGMGRTRGYSSSLPVGAMSFSPKIPFDMQGGGKSASLKAGLWSRIGIKLYGVLGFSATFGELYGVKASFNSIRPVNTTKNVEAFGYLFSQNADPRSLMDFNRFHDDAVWMESPFSSFSAATYDLFSASAQGMNSTFRPFRSGISSVHDPAQTLQMANNYKGVEVAGPGLIHTLKEKSDVISSGYSGSWSTPFLYSVKTPPHATVAIPGGAENSKAFIETTYFKELGELNARDGDYEAGIKYDQLVAPVLAPVGAGFVAFSPVSGRGREKRDIRNKHIECLTASQAKEYGLEKTINLYPKNTFSISSSTKLVASTSSLTNIDRTVKTSPFSGHAVDDHISEVSVTSESGDRYVYGIPSYNLYKKTVIFNASQRKEGSYISFGSNYDFSNPTTYSILPLAVSEACQYVKYDSDDRSAGNRRGLDNLYKIEETPPYASSFLLTNILSPDYVDVTGDGPSYDDLGNFTRFNYNKENNYIWREPFCINTAISGTAIAGSINTFSAQAHLEKGMLCDELDDKAMYQYGIRENYYVHSIETKNYVAVFKTSAKSDGIGVTDENGTPSGSAEGLKLDAIELYSKNEILRNGFSNAVPLKSVHFEYDYSLCGNTFNTISTNNPTRGKLTLKKVYFTYGSSKKSALSPYEFAYADNDHNGIQDANFNYHPRSMDRWGSYKPNSNTVLGATSGLNNTEFPYAEQNKILADQYSAAWNLTEIKTPGGATIKVTYEADDYGYVMNTPASQMCKIYNCVNSIVSNSVNVIATHSPGVTTNIKSNPQLIIDLSSMGAGVSSSLSLNVANDYARNFLFTGSEANILYNYGHPLGRLYFKCFLKVAGPECSSAIPKDYYEFINGFANIQDVGLFDAGQAANTYTVMNSAGTGTTSCYRFAYVTLKTDGLYDNSLPGETSPICLAGWDFLRRYAPRIAYPGSEPGNIGNVESPVTQLQNAKRGVGAAKVDLENGKLGNPNKRFFDQNFCTTLYPEKSFVRVFSANYKKLGGGHRVKSIITEDNWSAMTSVINTSGYTENSSVYGQTYDYTTTQTVTEDLRSNKGTGSSGVASYEPLVGGDENSLRLPHSFVVQKAFAPNDHLFQDAPLGEMLYPAPIVGYSKVTVRSIPNPSVTNVAGVGKTEFQFFTAKDFPIIDEAKTPSKEIAEQIPEKATLRVFRDRLDNPEYESLKVLHMVQGNILRFNDMHGKLRSVAIFGEDNDKSPVSKTEYFYKQDDQFFYKRLVTHAPAIDEHNVIQDFTLSRDIDVTADTRENMSETAIIGKNKLNELGISITIMANPPYVLITPDVPTHKKTKIKGNTTMGFRSATLTKVIQEYGILERVENTFNGSKIVTENLLWDANTGNVVLTKVTNNYEQPVYNFNYPAYWAYREMSHEFKRDGIRLSCPPSGSSPSIINYSNGEIDLSSVNAPEILQVGDEVAFWDVVTSTRIGERFWLFKHPTTSSRYLLIDQDGKELNSTNYSSLDNTHTHHIVVIRPINRNKTGASMGQVTSLTNPIHQTILTNLGSIDYMTSFPYPTAQIIDASAQEYCAAGSAFFNQAITSQTATNLPYDSYNKPSNPIIAGLYGDHKPTSSFKYQIPRSYGSQPNAKTDGLFTSFKPFWDYDSGGEKWVSIPTSSCLIQGVQDVMHDNWRLLNKNTNYSPHGQLLQSKDAVGLFSSQRFGFNQSLPILSASNASVCEVGFDSFEDYVVSLPPAYLQSAGSRSVAIVHKNDHLGFYEQSSLMHPGTKPSFTTTTAHTGRYSLAFGANQSVTLSHSTKSSGHYLDNKWFQLQPLTVYTKDNFCECMQEGDVVNCSKLDLTYKPYIISMWVKGSSPAADFSNLVTLNVKQSFTLNTTVGTGPPSYSVVPPIQNNYTPVKSAIINGWQKLDFEVPIILPGGGTTSHLPILEISISSGNTSGFYLDDFRIQPFNSTMVCNVYDPYQLRLWAQLDDRNYATIYEYDQEGMLVRKKKETLNTIYTLQETRSGKPKR